MSEKTSAKQPLLGFGLAGYRSFGKEMQFFGPLSKITLLAGPNNSGKSNVLMFVANHLVPVLSNAASGRGSGIGDLDIPVSLTASDFAVSLPIRNSGDDVLALTQQKHAKFAQHVSPGFMNYLNALLHAPQFRPMSEVAWIPLSLVARDANVGFVEPSVMTSLLQFDRVGNTAYGLSAASWRDLANGMMGRSADSRDAWVRETMGSLVASLLDVPNVEFVPTFRKVDLGDGNAPPSSGRGITHRLAELQSPDPTRRGDKAKFAMIERFLRIVTQEPTATMDITHDKSTIMVDINGRELPLAHLGTGIAQVVLLAAAATLVDNHVVCLEEPEMNLHPLLQKHLMRYLSEHTTNQYLISTHSAHLLDTSGATVYRLENVDGWTRATRVISPNDHLEVCRDLGYHASDLLQTNSVIWVEGPSDRIYLLNWISSIAPELKEGLHFSVMFYGGALLKHLSADESELNDWIALRKLNPNLAVVMDSDRKAANSKVGDAKLRVQGELDRGGRGVAWLTEATTIESYVPKDVLAASVKAVHPTKEIVWTGHKYGDPFVDITSPDKVAIARKVIELEPLPTNVHDLRVSLDRIVAMIRTANPAVTLNA